MYRAEAGIHPFRNPVVFYGFTSTTTALKVLNKFAGDGFRTGFPLEVTQRSMKLASFSMMTMRKCC